MILLCLYCFATRSEFRFIYHLHFLNISLYTLRMRNMCTRHSSVSCHSQRVSCHWATFRVATSRRIVRQTVASFSSVLLPRPRWTHAAQSLALSTIVCSTIFSINIFLSLPFSIFHFLLSTFYYKHSFAYLLPCSGHLKCNSLRNIPHQEYQNMRRQTVQTVQTLFWRNWKFLCRLSAVRQSVKAERTVNTHFE